MLTIAVHAQSPQTQVFRAGVELVTVDVLVLDKSGKQVTTLTAPDFVVTADGKPRRIVTAEYVPARRPVSVTSSSPEVVPATGQSASKAEALSARSIFFAVDVEEIRAGEGRAALRSISDYLDKLSPDDRVGLVSLPFGTPRVDLTTDRRVIREAAGTIAGSSNRVRDAHMTPGEAADISRQDVDALVAYWDRAVGLPVTFRMRCNLPPARPFDPPLAVSGGCVDDAREMLDVYRRHTANLLGSLSAIAEAMAPMSGPKAIVLVSEGLYCDSLTRDSLESFSKAAERSRVALYAMHLDAPLVEAGAGTGAASAGSRSLDDRIGFDSMATAATSARGTAFRVIGNATPRLQQIDTELAGYYLLSFERNSDDKDGKRVRIEVKVNNKGLDVRARREFTVQPKGKGAAH